MTGTMKEWALYYADMGLAVFPVKPAGKEPITPNGCKAATTDKQQVEVWWSSWPDANIGIATGRVSGGLVVIDLDIDEDKGVNGYDTLKQWQQDNGELPDTCQSITGRGGYHLFYRDGATNRCRVGLYEGVDIRGEGGYIVAPPSLHPNGNRYEWEYSPEEWNIEQVDSRVINFLAGPVPEGWGKQAFESPEVIPEGERTSSMIRLIGSLKSKGLDDESILVAVRSENERKCTPPLTEQELEKTVFPALRRGWRAERPYTAVLDNGIYRPVKEAPKVKQIEYINADALISAELPPVDYIVEGLLTKGLGGISAKSKLGKSWLVLQLGVAVANGDKFLGFSTKKSGVLYIDLENMPALSQERLRVVLDGREPPKNLRFAYDFNIMGQGFEEDLNQFLQSNPDVKLVIIDVFQKVKRPKKINQTDYEADYETLTEVREIAVKNDVCILPVYHDRKFIDATDPFANLLGSTALMGVSDFMWVLYKEKREDPEATLAMTGRTIREQQYKLKKNGALWENLGNAAALEETRKRREYDTDPLVNTIRKLVEQGKGKWKGRVKEIIESSQYFKGCRIYGTSQKVGAQIKGRVEDLEKYDGIHHSEISKGNAGVIHVFEYSDPFSNLP